MPWLVGVMLLVPAVSSGSTRADAPAAVRVEWGAPPLRSATIAATVEVDIMPFLARGVDTGGPFDAYFEALQGLGNSYVRFAPWFPYWQARSPQAAALCTAWRACPHPHDLAAGS